MNNELHLDTLESFENKCDYCNGKGGEVVEGRGTWRRCGACNGSGFVPTAVGEMVLSLMRHNFAAMLEDAQR